MNVSAKAKAKPAAAEVVSYSNALLEVMDGALGQSDHQSDLQVQVHVRGPLQHPADDPHRGRAKLGARGAALAKPAIAVRPYSRAHDRHAVVIRHRARYLSVPDREAPRAGDH